MEKLKAKFRYYFKPNSLVWWSGVAMVGLGTAQAVGVDNTSVLIISEVISGLNGSSAAPAQMILFGLAAVGIGARKGEKS